MKKTFRLLGIGLLAASVCLFSCNKAEDDEEEEGGETSELTVSKTPQKRNVLIEEFTGNYCGYCPYNQKYVAELIEANPGKICVVNYHCYSDLSDHYRTTIGENLYSSLGTAIPDAMFNRRKNSGGTSTAGNCLTPYANQIMALDACANIAARATINKSTRKLTVEVKVYYTANSNTSTNKLNIALIQDNIMGFQASASANPGQVVGNQYRHMEVFRDFVTTGQWGLEISPTTEGSTVSKTVSYDIPESYTDLDGNTEAAVLENLRVVVFVAEGNKEVINACNVQPTLK